MTRSWSEVLASFAGRDVLRDGHDADAVDGRVPRVWLEPESSADVSSAVAAFAAERWATVVVGGATQMAAGNLPRRLDACLSTRRLDRVVEFRPEDMTVTAQAGVTHAMLAAVLARDGQRLALDPCDPERATLGGMLSANTTGGLAYGFGQPRDLVLGMTVVDGKARELRIGGRVVKNVAGYDLVRLFCGSYGSLGAIVEITWRTHPLPQRAATVDYRFSAEDAADRAAAALRACSLPLAALDFESCDSAGVRIVARAEGTAREVEAQVRDLDRTCEACDARDACDVRASPVHPRADETLVVRVGVAPADALDVARELREACGATLRVAGRLGDGTLRACTSAATVADAVDLVRKVRATATRFGGGAFVERLHPLAKAEIDAWGEPPLSIALMRAIKLRFDPADVFAPGRFVGGI